MKNAWKPLVVFFLSLGLLVGYFFLTSSKVNSPEKPFPTPPAASPFAAPSPFALPVSPSPSLSVSPDASYSRGAVGTKKVEIVSSGTLRSYLLRTPSSSKSLPLVIALHGRFQGVEDMQKSTDLERLADEKEFILAFPSAVGGGWNAGSCCSTGSEREIPDVVFLDDVIKDVSQKTGIDLKRVYIVGFSNGGMMSYRYACERSGSVAGIGVVSGAMVVEESLSETPPLCKPSLPVSLLHVHGTKDNAVSSKGGFQSSLKTTASSLEDSVSVFARVDNCKTSAVSNSPSRTEKTYEGCTGGKVKYILVKGLGHAWSQKGFGINTSRELWDYLSLSSR